MHCPRHVIALVLLVLLAVLPQCACDGTGLMVSEESTDLEHGIATPPQPLLSVSSLTSGDDLIAQVAVLPGEPTPSSAPEKPLKRKKGAKKRKLDADAVAAPPSAQPDVIDSAHDSPPPDDATSPAHSADSSSEPINNFTLREVISLRGADDDVSRYLPTRGSSLEDGQAVVVSAASHNEDDWNSLPEVVVLDTGSTSTSSELLQYVESDNEAALAESGVAVLGGSTRTGSSRATETAHLEDSAAVSGVTGRVDEEGGAAPQAPGGDGDARNPGDRAGDTHSAPASDLDAPANDSVVVDADGLSFAPHAHHGDDVGVVVPADAAAQHEVSDAVPQPVDADARPNDQAADSAAAAAAAAALMTLDGQHAAVVIDATGGLLGDVVDVTDTRDAAHAMSGTHGEGDLAADVAAGGREAQPDGAAALQPVQDVPSVHQEAATPEYAPEGSTVASADVLLDGSSDREVGVAAAADVQQPEGGLHPDVPEAGTAVTQQPTVESASSVSTGEDDAPASDVAATVVDSAETALVVEPRLGEGPDPGQSLGVVELAVNVMEKTTLGAAVDALPSLVAGDQLSAEEPVGVVPGGSSLLPVATPRGAVAEGHEGPTSQHDTDSVQAAHRGTDESTSEQALPAAAIPTDTATVDEGSSEGALESSRVDADAQALIPDEVSLLPLQEAGIEVASAEVIAMDAETAVAAVPVFDETRAEEEATAVHTASAAAALRTGAEPSAPRVPLAGGVDSADVEEEQRPPAEAGFPTATSDPPSEVGSPQSSPVTSTATLAAPASAAVSPPAEAAYSPSVSPTELPTPTDVAAPVPTAPVEQQQQQQQQQQPPPAGARGFSQASTRTPRAPTGPPLTAVARQYLRANGAAMFWLALGVCVTTAAFWALYLVPGFVFDYFEHLEKKETWAWEAACVLLLCVGSYVWALRLWWWAFVGSVSLVVLVLSRV